MNSTEFMVQPCLNEEFFPDICSVRYPGNRVVYTTIDGLTQRYGISKGCNGYDHVAVQMEDNLTTIFVQSDRLQLADANEEHPLEVPLQEIRRYLQLYPYPGNESVEEILLYGSSFHYEPLYFFFNQKFSILLGRPDFDWLLGAEKYPYWKRLFECFTKLSLPNHCSPEDLLELFILNSSDHKELLLDQIEFQY
ncbi:MULTISPECIES: hypothetical protein [Paenibacillus]|uniref:Uncharacterized protein n=1 Tax=Paenibacillus vandeheii TaxID=3035917 RepID=A0ABT8JFH6_9BACL|nr:MULTISPECIES: hypothetical protein [Paenibacillus]KGP81937.1 hypothetical protein P364_0114020 [Paenibacillus sp. MAEPY2]KGP86023.1 hypothetical protein P363_0119495 [Paenibacillus sp. MAEPY1]MDN4603851.1 hypothetical protein [Paenibacillus vandeheii]